MGSSCWAKCSVKRAARLPAIGCCRPKAGFPRLFGEAHGIVTGAGGETATWVANGVGKMTGKGSAASWRGAVYYQTAAPPWARLNSVVAVFEYEADGNGNSTAKLRE